MNLLVTRPLPINRQIYQDLVEQIEGGVLSPGDSLPTEKELQRRYGVSRVPIRQALGRLEARGHIRRTPGRGTEVVHPQLTPWVHLSGFTHFYNRVADRVSSRTLSLETVAADEETATHFEVEPGTPVLLVRRIRLLEGEPLAYMCNYFLMPEEWERGNQGSVDDFSLQHFLRRYHHRDEAEASEQLKAVIAPGEVSEVLGLGPGEPVLYVIRHGWDADRRPIEFSRYWARTEQMSYRTVLTNAPRN